jgi:hypothetical protein
MLANIILCTKYAAHFSSDKREKTYEIIFFLGDIFEKEKIFHSLSSTHLITLLWSVKFFSVLLQLLARSFIAINRPLWQHISCFVMTKI